MSDKDIEYLKNAQTITVKDGDVVVISVDGPVSMEGANMIREHIKAMFPNNKCLVLSDKMEVGVMREATDEQ